MNKTQIATFAAGYFWCYEAVFSDLKGVVKVTSGYIGGEVENPTTLNRQGNDVGTQYRSAIFYHNDEQKMQAEKSKAEMDESKEFADPIVTEITEASEFYPAEDYHQNYYQNNPRQGYCQVIISPKMNKFREKYREWLK